MGQATRPLRHDGPVDGLSVALDAGEIVVTGHDGDHVEGEAVLSWSLGEPSFEQRADGTVLFLRWRRRALRPSLVRAHLRVPRTATLELTTRSGAIKVRDVTGQVVAESQGGGVELIGVGGPVSVRTGTGALEGWRLRCPLLHVEVGSGPVTVAFAAAPEELDVATVGGAIDVAVPAAEYRVVVDGGDGPPPLVAVAHVPGAERLVRLASRSGAIAVRVAGADALAP